MRNSGSRTQTTNDAPPPWCRQLVVVVDIDDEEEEPKTQFAGHNKRHQLCLFFYIHSLF